MKKLTSLAIGAVLTASLTATAVLAAPADEVVTVNVMDGLCTLIDNAATNNQASGYALCFADAYGTGRTTEDDAVNWKNVTFEKDVKQVAIKCGYNLGGDKAGTATEFWLYLNKIDGEPIAKVTVSDSETKSSQIVDQVYKFADVDIKAGTYDVIIVGKTEYSGSVSQVNFMYEAMDADTLTPIADANRKADLEKINAIAKAKTNIVQLNVIDGLCTLIDNAATNNQASGYPLCFADAYGTGRTTEDDAVTWEKVKFANPVKQIAVKCGYNLGGDKAGTATEFWVYLNKVEGEPIAKVTVSDSETKSSQIVDQVYKTVNLDTPIEAGEYTIIIVGKTEYSGSVSQINFMYEAVDFDDEAAVAQFTEIANAKRSDDVKKGAEAVKARKEAEEKAKAEAEKDEEKDEEKKEDETKSDEKAPETEVKQDEEKKEDETKSEEKAPENDADADANAEDDNKDDTGSPIVPIVIVVVVVVVVVGAIVIAKKKK